MNPLLCAYAGPHIGFMPTGDGVETNVWKCLLAQRPTTTAMCSGCEHSKPTYDLPDDTEPHTPHTHTTGY